MPIEEGLGRLRRIGLYEAGIRLRQVHAEEVNLLPKAVYHPHRLAKVHLRMPRWMRQRHERLPAARPALPHIILHHRVAAAITMLVPQPLEDPLGCAFLDLDDPEADPTHQIYCLGIMWPDSYAPSTPSHGLTLHSALVKPRSRGTVRLNGADPHGEVEVDPQFLSDADDLEEMVRGVKMLRQIIRTAPLAEVVTQQASPGARASSDAELGRFCREVVVSNAHASGNLRDGAIG